MRILITNDDGVRAPGLIALAEAVARLGDVVIVAPATQQSAVSHSITLHKPLRCTAEKDFPVEGIRVFSTNGTPTDAVLLGIHAVFGERPDVILSGINAGPNLGADVTYSGTVAGAMEGVVARVPSIAISMGAFDNLRYADCAEFASRLAAMAGDGVFPDDVLLNVNYPNIPPDEIKGIAITRLGRRWYDDVLHKRVDPRGREYYWITGKLVQRSGDRGTDACELDGGYISVTPLSLDMTRSSILTEIAEILTDSAPGNQADSKLQYTVHGPKLEQ